MNSDTGAIGQSRYLHDPRLAEAAFDNVRKDSTFLVAADKALKSVLAVKAGETEGKASINENELTTPALTQPTPQAKSELNSTGKLALLLGNLLVLLGDTSLSQMESRLATWQAMMVSQKTMGEQLSQQLQSALGEVEQATESYQAALDVLSSSKDLLEVANKTLSDTQANVDGFSPDDAGYAQAVNRALSSKLSLVSFEASKNTAASMVREGMDVLAGSIAQSTLQVGITAVGAKKQYDGLSNERGALKNNAARLEALNAESRQIRNTLNSHNTTRLAADGDDMMHLETHSSRGTMRQSLNEESVVSNADASDSLGLQSSNERLSPEHQAALSRHLESIDADIDVQHRTLEDNKIKARDKQLLGDAIMRSSQAVGSIAGSSGQYTATQERSEQQISQASSRVATMASEDSRESAQGNLSMLQEMLRMIDNINQSKSNTIGVIAGNLRA